MSGGPVLPALHGSPAPEDRLDWSFVDAAYCISLKTRGDRVAQAAVSSTGSDLCRRVTFYRPDKHPRNGFIGSWMSHRDVAMHALERGCARTLICEDDVLFTRRIRPATLRASERALRALPTDWTIFFLGHWRLPRTSCGTTCCARRRAVRTPTSPARASCVNCAITPGVLPACSSAGSRARGSTPRTRNCRGLRVVSLADNPACKPERQFRRPVTQEEQEEKKLKHLVTRSAHREVLLSRLMRPFEFAVGLLSPAFFLVARMTRGSALAQKGSSEAVV